MENTSLEEDAVDAVGLKAPCKRDRNSKSHKPVIALCSAILATLLVIQCAADRALAAPPNISSLRSRRIFVDPASTRVSLGKAKLIVMPLCYEKGIFVGNYELEVIPYFFKSEKGSLVVLAPDELVRKLSQGLPVKFTGKATNSRGVTKVLKGKAIPSTGERGFLTFSITTAHGEMVFNTSYYLDK